MEQLSAVKCGRCSRERDTPFTHAWHEQAREQSAARERQQDCHDPRASIEAEQAQGELLAEILVGDGWLTANGALDLGKQAARRNTLVGNLEGDQRAQHHTTEAT